MAGDTDSTLVQAYTRYRSTADTITLTLFFLLDTTVFLAFTILAFLSANDPAFG